MAADADRPRSPWQVARAPGARAASRRTQHPTPVDHKAQPIRTGPEPGDAEGPRNSRPARCAPAPIRPRCAHRPDWSVPARCAGGHGTGRAPDTPLPNPARSTCASSLASLTSSGAGIQGFQLFFARVDPVGRETDRPGRAGIDAQTAEHARPQIVLVEHQPLAALARFGIGDHFGRDADGAVGTRRLTQAAGDTLVPASASCMVSSPQQRSNILSGRGSPDTAR